MSSTPVMVSTRNMKKERPPRQKVYVTLVAYRLIFTG
jgi:hypothetical protein